MHYTHCILFLFIKLINTKTIVDDYEKIRTNLFEEEINLSLGGNLQLNEEEGIANETLMKLKEIELEESFRKSERFNFSRHYFTYRDYIEKSKVYQIIRRMPKGAALHIHSTLMLGPDFMLQMTYEDHLYVCTDDDNLILQFSETTPQRPCLDKWTLLSELRNASDDVNSFDAELRKHFTLYSDDNIDLNTDINTVWRKFNQVYLTIKQLILYRPVREKFFYEALQRFYKDNVMYIEMRSGLHSLYELNGTKHEPMYMAKLYQDTASKFIEHHSDFIGIKLILTKHRKVSNAQVREALDKARQLKREMPELFAGFDLVGQEDLGKPLTDFLPALLEAKNEMNFYFHGGETNWYGTSSDENLIDAILLGSKRIGHAYALTKHPTLMDIVIKKGIALEVNVISNAVLSLVKDVRNHPLATYLAFGLPVVLSSDDPGVWGADPLSHDFYVAFVAVASKHADLRMLKQLAINSIRYSALSDRGKVQLFSVFNRRWTKFIKEVIALSSEI